MMDIWWEIDPYVVSSVSGMGLGFCLPCCLWVRWYAAAWCGLVILPGGAIYMLLLLMYEPDGVR